VARRVPFEEANFIMVIQSVYRVVVIVNRPSRLLDFVTIGWH